MKQVSVVIPCYNQGEYLEEALDSVFSQSYENFEITIVNDGSTDQYTLELLASIDKPKCNVLHTENQGLPAARNTGIRSTEGDYICCLDADDKYHTEYFSRAVKVFEQDEKEQYGAVPAWVQFFGSNTTIWKTMGHNIEGFDSYQQGLRNNVQSATMFRRVCWEKIGGYDESMTSGYEDWDFWIKMLDLGYQWFCIEEPLIYYRQKTQSMVTRADEIRPQILEVLIKNNLDFYSNHLMPMLLERDREVLNLQKENKLLGKRFQEEHNDNESSGKKSILSNPLRSLSQSLKKFFPYK